MPIHTQIAGRPGSDDGDTCLTKLDVRRRNVQLVYREVRDDNIDSSEERNSHRFLDPGNLERYNRRDCFVNQQVFDEIEAVLSYENRCE